MEITTNRATPSGFQLRDNPRVADADCIRHILESTGYFYANEVDVAIELLVERLNRGTQSGYYFLFLDRDDEPLAYTCFGPIACTQASFDLFWIAVHRDLQGSGIGRWILEASERQISAMGGQRVYIETSGRPQYASTRGFYLRCGYREAAVLEDFYGPGDPKVIYEKALR